MQIKLTARALEDLNNIYAYSITRWGGKVADKYIVDIETALNLIKENSNILKQKPQISKHFTFYHVREHILVFVVLGKYVILLTVKHGSMDLPNRITKLEPTLLLEAELLYNKLLTNTL